MEYYSDQTSLVIIFFTIKKNVVPLHRFKIQKNIAYAP